MRVRPQFTSFIARTAPGVTPREVEQSGLNFAAPLSADAARELRDTVSTVGDLNLTDRRAAAHLDQLRDQELIFTPKGQRELDESRDSMLVRWQALDGTLRPEALATASRLIQVANFALGAGLLLGAAGALEDGCFAVQVHRQTSNEFRAPNPKLETLAGDRFSAGRFSQPSLMKDTPAGVLMVDTVDGVAFLAPADSR